MTTKCPTVCRDLVEKNKQWLLLPVEGCWLSLGLTTKHNLFATLSRLNGEHHAAWLFGEDGS